MGFVEKYGLSHQNIAFFSSPSLDPAILKQEIALRLNHTFPRGSKKAQALWHEAFKKWFCHIEISNQNGILNCLRHLYLMNLKKFCL